MAKKSFKGENPALRYISVQNTEHADNAQDAQHTGTTQSADNTDIVHNAQYTHNTQYASIAQEDRSARPARKETKSKRLNVLIRPSLHDAASKVAHMQRVSVNELIHLALEEYVEARREDVEKYDEVYGG